MDVGALHSCHKVAALAALAYSFIEIDAQISVKPTHASRVGGEVARRCFAHSVAAQLQKNKHV